MAQVLQRLILIIAIILLANYFACLEVSGIAFKQEEDHNKLQVRERDHPEAKLTSVEGNKFRMENGTVIELFPVSEPHLQLQTNSSRRKLGDFMSCSSCKCCDKAEVVCQNVPCCYHINCYNQPYGQCKFEAFSCNCNGCGM